MSLYARPAAFVAVLMLLAGGGWWCYGQGKKTVRAEWNAEKLVQTEQLATFNENQRLIERARQTQTTKAQNDRAIKNEAAKSAIASASAELVGLRSDIYALDTNASGEPRAACQVRAATARAVFEQCAQRYSDVAGKADGHAADAVMLIDAWPK